MHSQQAGVPVVKGQPAPRSLWAAICPQQEEVPVVKGQPAPHEYHTPESQVDPKAPVCEQQEHIRLRFIRKVYTILSVQLLITTVIGAFITQQPKPWIREHAYLHQLAGLVTLAAVLGVSCCCQDVAKQFPINYVFLGVVTMGIGVTSGFVASLYTAESVILAMAATSAVFFCLTAYACLTKTDFTGMGPYLMAALLALISFGFVMMLFSMFNGGHHLAGMKTLFSLAGVVIFSLFIIYDTQLIIGGGHKTQEYSVDDYVFAALNIYLDVINLFLMLLDLMGDRE